MDLQIHLYNPQALETELQDKLVSIAERAFPSTNAQRPQVLSHFVGSRSYCIVASISSQPVAFLFFQSRTALSSGTELSLLSVGPVATDPNFQRRGIGSQLIGYLNSYAVESNVDLIILSGIPDYYTKYGFYPFMVKSKITISHHNLSKVVSTALPEVCIDKKILCKAGLSQITYGTEKFGITRSRDDWDWLLITHPDSYYFPNPVFLAQGLKPKATPQFYSAQYFSDKTLIREFHASNNQDAQALLTHLVNTSSSHSGYEFYTSYNSTLFRFLLSRTPFHFSAYPHPRARALMKIINPSVFSTLINSTSSCLLSEILSSPKSTVEFSSLLLERTGNCLEYYLPGLLSGLWFFPGLEIKNNKPIFPNEAPLLSNTPPFVYQGDAL